LKIVRRFITALLLFEAVATAQPPLKFMGRTVTVTTPGTDAEGVPKGPATVCLEGPPQTQCYTAPKDFGNVPRAEVVMLKKDTPAIFFSAESGGVSGWSIHMTLLRPSDSRYNSLDQLLVADNISEQSQHEFRNEPSISNAQILLTADWQWGPDEGHFGAHRYLISAYTFDSDAGLYFLNDRYMTLKKYDREDKKADILKAEKAEILARLKRIKAAYPLH
jgi:hypothetical protein